MGKTGCRLAPMAPCAKSLAQDAQGEDHRAAETSRPSLRGGLTAYGALSPVSRALLPPSPCGSLMRTGPVGPSHHRKTWRQRRAPGPRDFAVRASAGRRARRPSLTGSKRTALRLRNRADAARVHRIPARVSDDRETPLLPGRNATTNTLFPNFCKAEYFCARGLTRAWCDLPDG